jgi:superfamily I DNA/RNA helicase
MPNLAVVFGPPGTGKTTELARLARQYVDDEGSDSVLLCAYTKTAARELAGRDLPLEPHQVGTLHSHCYHALDRPTIAEPAYQEWNEANPLYPLSRQKSPLAADDPGGSTPGTIADEYLNQINVLRHRLVPEDRWPYPEQLFWKLWQKWKHERGYLDFTDLIDRARFVVPVAPGRPATIIADEAQDLSLLQWDLLTRWGRHATRVIAAGDDDQALYRWCGADFRPLLAAPQRRVLPQSYRVPRRLQAWATRYAESIQQRHPKTWESRAEEGTLLHEGGTWEAPDMVIARLTAWLEEPWGTYACIAPCSYMLEPLIEALEQEGLPFSNRWRPHRRDWNPLAPPAKGVGIMQRLLDFARPPDRLWSWQELATWVPLIRADGVLRRKAKTHVTLHADEAKPCTMGDLEDLFLPGQLDGALRGDLHWLADNLLQSRAKALAYPLRVYRRFGREGLLEMPRITIGTAHSLKGAEADTVVFWQDLSRAQRVALCEGGEGADDVYRMLYVACTRARETLIVIGGNHG